MQRGSVQEKGAKQVLVFSLLNEELALDISCVREVLRFQEIHPLPRSPDFIEGVTSVRKNIITVIDLRKKFNIKSNADKSEMRIIVCRLNNFVVGLIVDKVKEVLTLSSQEIQPTPEIVSRQKESACIRGIARAGERVITLLDLEKILTSDEIASFSNIIK